ncbi:molecular chaperone TorD family protein [Limnobacter sp.]|uniref:TorD/DmsD family molecular chaperone n=1 Tax=Limnobacter sp. TaxID=2003368 RepID=UPI00258C8F28|nr:molecular chaperone TorD family protein [Limnobacter sp.]HEX5486924.1 molecular chaperone TorD family protein [Limnobacter sp.]
MTSVHPRDNSIAGEDWARADFYSLLAQLFAGRVDDSFLARFREIDPSSVDLASPLGFEFSELLRAVKHVDSAAIKSEYDDSFIGVGRPEIFLFGSYYQTGFLNEKPLIKLRNDLAALGLERDESMVETEDHLAFLCEVMRYLILADDPPVAFSVQREFFHNHIAGWYEEAMQAIEHGGKTDFYKVVGRLAKVFFDVETQSFDFEHAV